MKKLLFLFPVKEYFWNSNKHYLVEILNEMINKRYRQKGYQVNYLVFNNRDVAYLDVYPEDIVLKSSVEYNADRSIPYTSNKLIAEELGEVSELVIGGFHECDCVKKVAYYFTNLGIDTLVDIELTDKIEEYHKYECFDIEKYNLCNIMECGYARNLFKDGEDSWINLPYSIYFEPYYKKGSFKPDYTWQEYLQNMKKNVR